MEKKVVCTVWVLFLVVGAVMGPAGAISCSDAVSAMVPCGSFLVGSGGARPTAQCCQSVLALQKKTATRADLKALCLCLKQTGPSFGVLPEKAKLLPQLCKLKINMPISPDIDCQKI
ncbi:non-specific lipid-transfer protein-like [Aristolochia californica]|uniref:non-specific lipid-transfer protein-like n=1 Tax=Aristolochia californica TaxID=171875 RepID=UPI0035DAEE99